MQIEIQRTRLDKSKFRVVQVDWEGKAIILADNLRRQSEARQQARELSFQMGGVPVINRVDDPQHYTFSEKA